MLSKVVTDTKLALTLHSDAIERLDQITPEWL